MKPYISWKEIVQHTSEKFLTTLKKTSHPYNISKDTNIISRKCSQDFYIAIRSLFFLISIQFCCNILLHGMAWHSAERVLMNYGVILHQPEYFHRLIPGYTVHWLLSEFYVNYITDSVDPDLINWMVRL